MQKKFTKDNKNVKDHCHFTGKYRGATHNKYNMNYKITKDIPVVFHNGSIYGNRFIIKERFNDFEGEFGCLGENTEKYITFSVKIDKKNLKKDEDGNDKIVNIPYRLKFIDSYRFMLASLSSLVNSLSDGLHNNKCVDCKSSLEYLKVGGTLLIFKCLNCNKNCSKDFDKDFQAHIIFIKETLINLFCC